MPPVNYYTFVSGNISITIGTYGTEERALVILMETVRNPLDFKLKT
jgi:hypothetical protein